MKITGTKDAFLYMLQERGIYNKLGINRSAVSNWKKALQGGDPKYMPTLDKMEEMLQKAGAIVVREKVWQLK